MANLMSFRLLKGRNPPNGLIDQARYDRLGMLGLMSAKIAYEDCQLLVIAASIGCFGIAVLVLRGCWVFGSILIQLTKNEETFSSKETTTRMVELPLPLRVMQQSVPVVLTTVEVTLEMQQDQSQGCVYKIEIQALVRLASCSSLFCVASSRVELAGRTIWAEASRERRKREERTKGKLGILLLTTQQTLNQFITFQCSCKYLKQYPPQKQQYYQGQFELL